MSLKTFSFNYVSARFSLCFFLLAIASVASAQPPKEYLLQVLAAYGPWSTLQSLHYASDRANTNPWQSYSYTSPKASAGKTEFFIDFDKGSFQNHSVFNFPGGYVFDFVTIGKDSARYFYDKNKARNGNVLVKQGKDSYVANMNAGLQSLPYYIIKALAETKDSTTYSNSGAEMMISRFLKNGTRIDYLFDQKTNLLNKMERTTGGKKFGSLFENYKLYNGLQVAGSVRQTVDGQVLATESFTTFESNIAITPSAFVVPASYTLQPAVTPQPLQAKAIAKDVYLIDFVGGDRNVVFVSMNDYIVVTEAPLSSDITKAVLDVIHKQVPGKPVKYVHLSHHHSDHTSGIRQMVAEGATVLCTSPIEAPMKAIVNGAFGAAADDYSKNPTQPKFELINGVKVLEDKDHRLEFHTVKNSHADGLSFMYLPKEGIIYEGDLLTIPEDGTITPAIEVNREFNSYLKQNKVTYKRIIGHHSHAFITPEMFGKMLSAK